MDENSHEFEVFLDVQSGLPRQGPGNDDSTLQALSFCNHLPDNPVVLDVGCGPGMQTLALARALNGKIVAVDIHKEYLDELETRAEAEGFAERLEVVLGDMQALSFREHYFDLVWSEGAAYIMGFENALRSWKKLLKPQGYIAISELVWLCVDPPDEVAEFFGSEYPVMTDIEANLTTLRSCGYESVGHFTLPDVAWWDDYYTPLQAKLPSLLQKYSDDTVALEVIEMARREIALRQRYSNEYGYEFFVARADVSTLESRGSAR